LPIILTIRGKIIIKTELVKVSPNETIPLSTPARRQVGFLLKLLRILGKIWTCFL